jgi:hypothetical protein
MGILAKLIAIAKLAFSVGPAIIADVETAVAKIKADKTVMAKIHDALDAAIAALSEVGKLFV